MAKKFLTPLGLVSLPSDPANGVEGQVYFNSTIGSIKIYANGQWDELSGEAGASVIYSSEQPDVNVLQPGAIWIDSDAEATGGGGGGAGSGNEYNNTTDILEGSNLFFTNQRAINAGSATYILQSNQQGIVNSASAAAFASASAYTNQQIATIDLESIDLSATIQTASAAAFASASAYTNSEINNLTTTSIEEGSGLYFTNQRAINAGSATYILQSNQQGIIDSASAAAVNAVLDGAPGALNTLNELASALNDDQNFATTVTNSLSQKLDTSTASSVYLTQSSASSIYAKKTNRWRKTYSFSGNETFTVTNNGSGNYVVAGVSNPTFNLVKGNTYTFIISASGHPFWIQTQFGYYGGYDSQYVYSTGTANLGTANGTITWAIPANAPDTLYYVCQFHSSMKGTINLIDPLKISGVDDNSNNLLYSPGYELLHINGVLLATNEYTTNSSSLITLNEALSTNDVVDIVIGG